MSFELAVPAGSTIANSPMPTQVGLAVGRTPVLLPTFATQKKALLRPAREDHALAPDTDRWQRFLVVSARRLGQRVIIRRQQPFGKC